MKKIYTKTVFEFNKKTGQYMVNENESHHYYVDDSTPIAEMKGGGGGTVVQTQTSKPWQAQIPYLTRGFKDIEQEFLGKIPQYYPGETVAGFSPTTEEAQQGILQRAREGSPLMTSDLGMLNKTLSGDFLYGGEGFNKALDAAKNQIFPQVDSTFEKYGRGGSGLADVAKTQALGDAFAKQYGAERENQFRAAGLAPQASQMRYNDLDRMMGVGTQQDLLNQQRINEGIDRWDFEQNARKNALQNYMKMIQGNYGGTISSVSPNQGLSGIWRLLAGGAGGAMQGFGATGSPWGAAAGGALGLLGAYQ